MKKPSLKRLLVLMICSIMLSSVSFSQLSNVDFLRSVQSDGINYIQAYISPWAKAFGAGLNGSWYNTAKPHKLVGFDITFGANVGMVPSSDKTFDLGSLNLPAANYSSTAGGLTGAVPTVAGSNQGVRTLSYSVSGVKIANFDTPSGSKWGLVPVPTLQVGIGLPLGTEVKVRYIPDLTIKGQTKVGLWGVGLMHSIMQYIPGNKLLPVDVSIFAGYTKLSSSIPLNLSPESGITSTITLPIDNQKFSATVDALNVSAIASVSVPVLTIYGGVGYSKTNTTAKLSGNFPTPTLNTGTLKPEYTNAGVKTGESFPSINIKDFSGLRANIGLRIKLAVITIHADYTRAQYNVFSGGLGVSFR